MVAFISARHRVAVLVRHGLMPLELGLVHQMFGQASSADGEPLYEVSTCALVPGEVRTDADFPVFVRHGPDALAEVVPPHRDGGQAQFIQRPVPEPRLSSTAAARAWALEHLDRPFTLRELAARESMSVRTFTRRFREEVGMSPARWLTRQRVERARQLLEETDLPVDRIAADAGFGTAASLRQHLRTALGVSPSTYRGTFRGPAHPGPVRV